MRRANLHLREYLESQGVRIPPSNQLLCPFHADKEPSAHFYETDDGGAINPHLTCFACGDKNTPKAFDIFAAIMFFEHCDFLTAKKRAFEFAGIQMPAAPARKKTWRQKEKERAAYERQIAASRPRW